MDGRTSGVGSPAAEPTRRRMGHFVSRRLLTVTMFSALSVAVGRGLPSDWFEPVLGAAAATVNSTMIVVSAFVPLACTISTGTAIGPQTPSTAGNPFRATMRQLSATAAPGPASDVLTGGVAVSITAPAVSNCSDGSSPSVSVEQSSGVISAESVSDGARTFSSGDRAGGRIVTTDLSLDGGPSSWRVVTVTY